MSVFGSQRNLQVDKVEKLSSKRYICLFHFPDFSSLIHQEPIDKEKFKRCVGFEVKHPSKIAMRV